MEALLITIVGFAAQTFFFGRTLLQWALAEKFRKLISPSIYWVLSLMGSYLMCLYGYLRDDFAIVLGQFVSYYVYIWNLKAKGILPKIPAVIRWVLILSPVVAIVVVARNFGAFAERFLGGDVPLWLVVFGSAGQIIFTLRFVYQFFVSRRHHVSMLPTTFWCISLVGSLTIVAYGIMRADVVLIVGQAVGIVAYSRNIYIGTYNQRTRNKEQGTF